MTATSASEEENPAQLQGRSDWEGSKVTPADISWITTTRRVLAGVACRLPAGETVPAPESGERVVFVSHFKRGFGLPVSDFFRDFLDTYDLQPHHLPANAVMILSAFAAFCEGFAGIEPFTRHGQNTFSYANRSLKSPGAGMTRQKLLRKRRTVL
jgi:hypothetical protein